MRAAATDTRTVILEAARSRLLADGHAGLSTRKVADEAGVPLSQLHYHFGSKQGLMLEVLRGGEPAAARAAGPDVLPSDKPLWQRYEQACDFLEDDLDSGYVRVLQEMIAEGWANREIGDATCASCSPGGSCCSPTWPGGRGPARPARAVHGRGSRHAGRQTRSSVRRR